MPLTVIEEGPWAGWSVWTDEVNSGRFSDRGLGQLYSRGRADGMVECRIETGRAHTNGGDFLHGGFLMAVADNALYRFAHKELANFRAVTLTCNFEFLDAGRPGEPVDFVGEVIKETRKTLFVRGTAYQGARPVLAFSSTLRKVSIRDAGDG